jgi:hypothetical protein
MPVSCSAADRHAAPFPLSQYASRLEGNVEVTIITKLEARREIHHGCANPRPNPIAK